MSCGVGCRIADRARIPVVLWLWCRLDARRDRGTLGGEGQGEGQARGSGGDRGFLLVEYIKFRFYVSIEREGATRCHTLSRACPPGRTAQWGPRPLLDPRRLGWVCPGKKVTVWLLVRAALGITWGVFRTFRCCVFEKFFR